jgi:hypothetical protein
LLGRERRRAPTLSFSAPAAQVRACAVLRSGDYSIISSTRARSIAVREPERLGRPQIDDQFEFCRPLDRKIDRLGPVEDLSRADTDIAVGKREAGSVADQAAGRDEFTPRAPPCILHRRFPRTAGDRHGFRVPPPMAHWFSRQSVIRVLNLRFSGWFFHQACVRRVISVSSPSGLYSFQPPFDDH